MILEEEFEKNEEPWYDPQDLEHGKSWRSHPKLCLTVRRLLQTDEQATEA